VEVTKYLGEDAFDGQGMRGGYKRHLEAFARWDCHRTQERPNLLCQRTLKEGLHRQARTGPPGENYDPLPWTDIGFGFLMIRTSGRRLYEPAPTPSFPHRISKNRAASTGPGQRRAGNVQNRDRMPQANCPESAVRWFTGGPWKTALEAGRSGPDQAASDYRILLLARHDPVLRWHRR